MLRVAVVEADGATATTTGNIVVVSDESTQVPIALIWRVAGQIEYLTVADGERFQRALDTATFPSQRGYAAPKTVVRNSG